MDHSWTPNGIILLYIYMYIFYSHYNTDWIANTEIVLDPINSVIDRLRCMYIGVPVSMLQYDHHHMSSILSSENAVIYTVLDWDGL